MEAPLIYLDYASLVPPAKEAVAAMNAAARGAWGNPRSLHALGGRALHALDVARQEVADYLDCMPHEVVFTASGRSALDLGFALALDAAKDRPGPIVSSRLEHPHLQALVESAAKEGRAVRWLALAGGVPDDEDRRAMAGASMVAVSLCNHELGTLLSMDDQPDGVVRLLDAAQVAPWVPSAKWHDDRTFVAVSGAKLGAPMGVGVLRVPSPVHYAALEKRRPLESESPPWLAAIGLGAACTARWPHREEFLARARAHADFLLEGFRAMGEALLLNGEEGARLGPIVNVSFAGVFAKPLVTALSLAGVCISHTAACQSRWEDASPVVRAAYPTESQRAAGATRWSLSEQVTLGELAAALDVLKRTLPVLRGSAT